MINDLHLGKQPPTYTGLIHLHLWNLLSSFIYSRYCPGWLESFGGFALRFHVLPALLFVPLFAWLTYGILVWWYLPYLQRYPDIELPESLPLGFISNLKTVRIRALAGFVEEHTQLMEKLRSYSRRRAK